MYLCFSKMRLGLVNIPLGHFIISMSSNVIIVLQLSSSSVLSLTLLDRRKLVLTKVATGFEEGEISDQVARWL